MTNKEELAPEIWDSFVQKLESEWHKFDYLGHSIEDLKSTKKFWDAIVLDMRKTAQNRNIYIIGASSLRVPFINGGFTKGVKDKTLRCFVRYLGFESLGEFEKEVKRRQVAEKQDKLESIEKKDRAFIRKKIVFKVLGGLFVFVALIYVLSFLRKPDYERVILKANYLQFQAFLNLDHPDTLKLKKYYTENGPAFNMLRRIISKRKKSKSKLLIPPSTYSVLNIEVESQGKEKIIVKTTENWILYWDEDNSGEGPKYGKVTDQRYFLIKDKGRWKIESNDY